MQKLNAQKYVCTINNNVVQGRLSEIINHRTKYFSYEIFMIYGIAAALFYHPGPIYCTSSHQRSVYMYIDCTSRGVAPLSPLPLAIN